MKAILHLSLLLIIISLVAADIDVSTTQIDQTLDIFMVTGGEGVSITPRRAVGETYVFVDGELAELFTSMKKDEKKIVRSKWVGEHEIEIKSMINHEYAWDNFKIVKNDEPLALDYVAYDRDNRRLDFVIKGADAIHPDDMRVSGTSFKKDFTGFTALLNAEEELECYPIITTGKSVPFNCYAGMYPYTLDIEVNIGIRELITLNLTEGPEIIEDPKETEQVTSPPPNEGVTPSDPNPTAPLQENVEVQDDIVMQDTIPEQGSKGYLWIIGLTLIAVLAILYVAAHHKAHNKAAGKHHPQKEKKVLPKENHDLSYLKKP